MQPHKSIFAKDVSKMALAPLCTQILGLILMPIVTRLYNPDTYGILHLYGSIVMPIAVFVTMGYASSIVLPRSDRKAANMLCVSLIMTIIVVFLTVLFILFGSKALLDWLKVPRLKSYIWLVPISVFLYGLQTSFRFWNIRSKNFSRIAVSRIVYATVNKFFIIGAGFSGFAISGSLIAGSIVASMTMDGVLGARVWQESKELFKDSLRWRNMIRGIKRYSKFPIFDVWTSFFSRIANSIIIFLFSFYFSKSVIGYYGLGLAILTIPMTFAGTAIGEVFYQRGAKARYEGSNLQLVENLFKHMSWLSMLPFLMLMIIGDKAFGFIFGANWAEAGVYVQILSFKMFIAFIISPLLNLTNILEKQEFGLIFNLANTFVSFISITIGGILNNVYIALFLFSVLGGLVYFCFGLIMVHFVGLPLLKIFNILIKCFLSTVPVIIPLLLVKWYFDISALFLIVISCIFTVIYYGILFKKNKDLQLALISLFKKNRP